MPDLVLQNLSKSFSGAKKEPIAAVRDFSLHISSGELIAILGPSGSGKTTLLRLIAGLERPDAGTISLGSKLLNDIDPGERNVAMVFQSSALYPHMTIRENLGFSLTIRKQPKPEIASRVADAALILGISHLLERKPETLSGGERQRVSLGRALVQRPEIFLFDEPLSNLDAPFRLELRREIVRLHQSLKTTMIYVTHDQAEAMTLGERIVLMRKGRPEQIGTPQEIYQRPATAFVAEFIGSPPMNLFRGDITGNEKLRCFQVAGSQLRLELPREGLSHLARDGDELLLGIRAEHVEIADASSAGMKAQIELVERLGPHSIIHLRIDQTLFRALEWGDAALRVGDHVGVRFDSSALNFFNAQSGKRLS